MKRLIYAMLFTSLLLISGCGEGEVEDNKNYPKVVEEGKVSKKFFVDFDEDYKKTKTFTEAYEIFLEKEEEYPDIILEEEYVDYVFLITNQANLSHDDFKLKAKGEMEKDLHNHLKAVIISQKVYADNLREKTKNVQSDDEAYMFVVRGMMQKTIDDLDDAVHKYNLYDM